eukprot:3236780-Rhodomonas_salina.1
MWVLDIAYRTPIHMPTHTPTHTPVHTPMHTWELYSRGPPASPHEEQQSRGAWYHHILPQYCVGVSPLPPPSHSYVSTGHGIAISMESSVR